jgi:hypothetical protein
VSRRIGVRRREDARGRPRLRYSFHQELCQTDLRCLDAHAHLGNLHFDDRPDDAIRHYETGMLIGELSLGSDFTGLLPWGWIDDVRERRPWAD